MPKGWLYANPVAWYNGKTEVFGNKSKDRKLGKGEDAVGTNRRLLLIVAVLLVALLMAAGCRSEKEQAVDMPSVKTMTVTRTGEIGESSYAGEVKGRYESQLAFQVGGKVSRRHVDLGSRVKAGDVLMEIDTKDIKESENMAAAQVEAAKAQLVLAEANLNRYRKLYEEAAVSQAQYDQFRTSYDSAMAAVRQAEAQYAQSKNAFLYSKLTADVDGVVSAVAAEAGQVVAAGQSVVTLVRDGDLEVEIQLPENRLQSIFEGTPAAVTFWATGGLTVMGSVREIAPAADPASRTYKVRVSLVQPPSEVRIGMTANVIFASKIEEILTIPLSAVYQTGETPNVWVVENQAVHLQPIVIDGFGDDRVQVLSGLAGGEVIVTAGVHKLREGQQVRPLEGIEQ